MKKNLSVLTSMTTRRTMLKTAGVLVASAATPISSAAAKPPPGMEQDSPFSKWVRGLHTPWGNRSTSCCSVSDCRPAKVWRDAGQGLMARIDPADDTPQGFTGVDIPVPEKIILPPDDKAPPVAMLCREVRTNYDYVKMDMNGQPPIYVTPDRQWVIYLYCLSLQPGG